MKRQPLRCILLLLPVLVCLLLSCSATRSISEKILPGKPGPSKRIAIYPLVDQLGIGETKTRELSATLEAHLKESRHMAVTQPPKDIGLTPEKILSPLGGVKDVSAIHKISQTGIQAIVIGLLPPVEVTTERKGLWPFDKWRKTFTISLILNVVDTSDGTLILSHREGKSFSMVLQDVDEVGEAKVVKEESPELLPKLLKAQESAVEDALRKEPWKGRILEVKGGEVLLNGGTDVGLREGLCFEVFQAGNPIRTKEGLSLFPLGARVGRVTVSRVEETQAFCVPREGEAFAPGQIARTCP